MWRGYLKRWTKENDSSGKIFTYRNNPKVGQPEFEKTLLRNVGFEKYFYDMTGITQEDVRTVSQLIAYMQKDNMVKTEIDLDLIGDADAKRDFMETLLCSYENIDNENQFIEKIIKNDLSFYKNTSIQNTLDILREEMFYRIYTGESKYSDESLLLLTCDAVNIEEKDFKYDFLRFFFAQEERSPKVHEIRVQNLEKLKGQYPQIKDINIGFYVNSIMIFIAEQIAINLSTKFHTWIERIENNTDIPFITCDCPIVNMTGDKIGERHEYYFPLSPQIGLKLCTSYKNMAKGNDNKNIILTDREEVMRLNLQIAQNAFREIYADNDDSLKTIKIELCNVERE